MAIPFENDNVSTSAMASIRKYFDKIDVKVGVCRRKVEDQYVVYVWNETRQKKVYAPRNGHKDLSDEQLADLEIGGQPGS